MNKDLCSAFLKICIEHYQKVYDEGIAQNNLNFYGSPPQSIIISFGLSQNQKKDYWKPLAQKEAVFRYSSNRLQSVPLDTVPNFTENRMYYKEAYAELCYQSNGIAIMMIQFGKRYAQCYRYDIIINEKNIQLTNEKLLWIS